MKYTTIILDEIEKSLILGLLDSARIDSIVGDNELDQDELQLLMDRFNGIEEE